VTNCDMKMLLSHDGKVHLLNSAWIRITEQMIFYTTMSIDVMSAKEQFQRAGPTPEEEGMLNEGTPTYRVVEDCRRFNNRIYVLSWTVPPIVWKFVERKSYDRMPFLTSTQPTREIPMRTTSRAPFSVMQRISIELQPLIIAVNSVDCHNW